MFILKELNTLVQVRSPGNDCYTSVTYFEHCWANHSRNHNFWGWIVVTTPLGAVNFFFQKDALEISQLCLPVSVPD
jgi:hypothetical protein